jgi:hypothetical protein
MRRGDKFFLAGILLVASAVPSNAFQSRYSSLAQGKSTIHGRQAERACDNSNLQRYRLGSSTCAFNIMTMSELIPQDSKLDLLKDISHVALDLFPYFAPTTVILRLSLVVGQLFDFASEYFPDGSVYPDELFFQICALVISFFLLSRSAYPLLRATLAKTTELDQIVFQQLFEPVDISWLQYKSMLAAECVDWIKVPPGTLLVSEDEGFVPLQEPSVANSRKLQREEREKVEYLYWIYNGDAVLSFKGSHLYHVERSNGKSIEDPSAVGFLADMRFLYKLDHRKRKEMERKGVLYPVHTQSMQYPMATIHIGEKETTLMRINSKILFELMDHDDELALSMRSLLLKSLQRKVGHLLNTKATGILLPGESQAIYEIRTVDEILPKLLLSGSQCPI